MSDLQAMLADLQRKQMQVGYGKYSTLIVTEHNICTAAIATESVG